MPVYASLSISNLLAVVRGGVFFVLFSLFMVHHANAQNWQLIWSDEFNYSGQNDYYSARLNSTASWTYGRFEARMKLPGGWGTWPAFWLYPDDDFRYGTNPVTNYGWPNAGEIDIMENVGYDQNVIHASTHSACCFWAAPVVA